MKKIAIILIAILVVWTLIKRHSSSVGVSVPTSFPTSLYSPTLMTT